MPNAAPRTRPNRAVSAVDRTGLVNVGQSGGLPARQRHECCIAANQRPESDHVSVTRRPANAAEPSASRSARWAHGKDGETHSPLTSRSRVLLLQASGPSTSTSTRPAGRSRVATRRSRTIGNPPMPMLPSARRTVSQRPGRGTAGENTEQRCARAPAARASRTASSLTSMPSAATPRRRSAAASRPGPQPTSSVAPAQRSSSPASPARSGPRQSSTGTCLRLPSG